MSYTAIIQGLEDRLRTVDGVLHVLSYEPTAIEPPTIVSILDSFEREHRGQVVTMTYRTIHTLAIRWTDNAQAEQELRPFLNSICAAVDDDPQLGGTCSYATIVSGKAGFATIGGVTYRIVDFTSVVVEKKAAASRI